MIVTLSVIICSLLLGHYPTSEDANAVQQYCDRYHCVPHNNPVPESPPADPRVKPPVNQPTSQLHKTNFQDSYKRSIELHWDDFKSSQWWYVSINLETGQHYMLPRMGLVSILLFIDVLIVVALLWITQQHIKRIDSATKVELASI